MRDVILRKNKKYIFFLVTRKSRRTIISALCLRIAILKVTSDFFSKNIFFNKLFLYNNNNNYNKK